MMGVYAIFENGEEYGKMGGNLKSSTAQSYYDTVKKLVDDFDSMYYDNLFSARFHKLVEEQVNGITPLEVTPDTAQIYVPFMRTNNTDRAETYNLVAIFPNGKAISSPIEWGKGDCTNVATCVALQAQGLKEGEKVELRLHSTRGIFSTNGVAIATNYVTCVAATNSMLLPSLDAARLAEASDAANASGAPWGRWTLLRGAAADALPGCVAADPKSFQLRVTGGVVWDCRVRALGDALDKADFAKWCEENRVACTVVDQRNPTNDASLFTHAKAENGERGTRFLSRNGLMEWDGVADAAERDARFPAGTAKKVELFRLGLAEEKETVFSMDVDENTSEESIAEGLKKCLSELKEESDARFAFESMTVTSADKTISVSLESDVPSPMGYSLVAEFPDGSTIPSQEIKWNGKSASVTVDIPILHEGEKIELALLNRYGSTADSASVLCVSPMESSVGFETNVVCAYIGNESRIVVDNTSAFASTNVSEEIAGEGFAYFDVSLKCITDYARSVTVKVTPQIPSDMKEYVHWVGTEPMRITFNEGGTKQSKRLFVGLASPGKFKPAKALRFRLKMEVDNDEDENSPIEGGIRELEIIYGKYPTTIVFR